jgi:repressor LexA
MAKDDRSGRLEGRLQALAGFYRERGRMPSFSELGDLVGLRSKNAVAKLVRQFEERGVLARDERGRLIPRRLLPALRLLGTVEAGFPSPAEEELLDTLSLDAFLVRNPAATFILRVSGDSMSGAGILPGDMVLVDRSATPATGDIVIAEVDGEWTMKYLRKRGEKVTLLPANPKYKPIVPREELKVAGVVTAVVRQYRPGQGSG